MAIEGAMTTPRIGSLKFQMELVSPTLYNRISWLSFYKSHSVPFLILFSKSARSDPDKDYFAERVEKKKERVAKNETQRLKNLARQVGSTMRKGPSVDASIGIGIAPEEKSKEQVSLQLHLNYSVRKYGFIL